jgi:uncharacterized protein YcbX
VAVRTLSNIWIYPVKSLPGIRVMRAQVMQKGLQYDRRWMLIDEHGRFITQREHPQLALFQLSMQEDELEIKHKTSSSLAIRFKVIAENGVVASAAIWDDPVEVIEPSTAHSSWFSDCLGMPCRLVFFPEANFRQADPDYARGEPVSLADAFPFLIIGQKSLDDLNTRLPEPVTIRRFRPNFIFVGGEAYEEDQWKEFAIGKNKFRAVKRCSRCTLTTVDPETGIKGVEPLATLAKCRKEGNKIFFGQNAIAINYETIQEGDEITMLV